LNTDEIKTAEEKLADEAQKLYQNGIESFWYAILNQIMSFLKSLILHQTLIGAVLFVLITLYHDKKSGTKFKISDFIAKVEEVKKKLDSLLSK
jgi:hypoxanthine-guanine phosphoribosyltransferase